jgi:heme/copper-type cytochrome/quinol oxidase subunit 3
MRREVIPYTVDRRPDTGVNNVTLGIWLFLASELMLFGALFSAYALLRTAAVHWPSGPTVLSVPFGVTHTVVLLLLTTAVWRAGARPADARAVRARLGLACLLALVFLGAKTLEYRDEIRLGLLPSVNTFLATYFVLTGVHALHVIGGLIANLWVMAGASASTALTPGRLRALALYWAFVDLVWLAILVSMYLT